MLSRRSLPQGAARGLWLVVLLALLLSSVGIGPADAAGGGGTDPGPEDVNPPVVTVMPAPSTGWSRDSVTLRITASDNRYPNDTGVATLTYDLSGATVKASTPLDKTTGGSITISADGLTHLHARAADGNSNVTDVDYDIKVDTADPRIDLVTPDQGEELLLGSAKAAAYTCTDSRLASCVGSRPNGGNIDTAAVGNHTFTVTATDDAGRTTSVTRSYHVYGVFEASARPQVVESSARPGDVLHSSNGLYDPVPGTLACTWLRDGTPIAGATGQTYAVVAGDVGKTLHYRCTASRTDYRDLTVTSPQGAVVLPALPDTAPPTVTVTPDRSAISGWFADSVRLQVAAKEDRSNDSGVKTVSYELTGATVGTGTITQSSDMVTIGNQGITHLHVVATDNAGNSATHDVDVKVDRTDPAVSVTSPAEGVDVAVGTNLRAGFTCSDGESGLGGCVGSTASDAPLDTSTPGDHTFTVTATDNVGHTRKVVRHYHVYGIFDVEALPSIEEQVAHVGDTLHGAPGTARPQATGTDCFWIRDGVAIPDTNDVEYTTSAADEGRTVSFRCIARRADYRDLAMTAEPGVVIAKVPDTTAPVVTLAPERDATNGWYRTPITYTVRATDDTGVTALSYVLSGASAAQGDLDVAGGVVTVSAEGATHLKVTAVDAAANRTVKDLDVKVDLTDPGVSVLTPGEGAEYPVGASVRAGFACADGGSGVATCVGDVVNDVEVDTTTPGDHTFTVRAADESGRTTTVVRHYHVTGTFTVVAKPAIAESSAKVGETLHATRGEYEPAPTRVDCSWLRDGDAIPGATGTTYEVVVADAGKVIAFRCEVSRADYAARTSTSGDVTVAGLPVDTVPPVISVRPDREPTHGWYDDTVSFSVSATDDTEVASLTYAMTGATEESGELDPTGDTSGVAAEGITHVRFVATDRAGNETVQELDYRIDRTDPNISVSNPVEGRVYAVGASVRADFDCADAGSGLAECLSSVPDGDEVDTSVPGDYVFTVSATDKVGRTTTVERHYVVKDGFQLLSPPRITEQTARVGVRLHATQGAYDPVPTDVECHWLRDGAAIPGASGTTYKVVELDRGRALAFRCAVSHADYPPRTDTSAELAVADLPADVTPPVVTLTPERPATHGWYRGDIALTVVATDNGPDDTGVTVLRYELTGATTRSGDLGTANGGAIVLSAAGTTHVKVIATDASDNESVKEIDVKVDATNPAVNVLTPSAGTAYRVGASARAAFACSDVDSGIDTCVGSIPNGGLLDTSAPGSYSFAVTATDVAGLTTTVTTDYEVLGTFKAFTKPSILETSARVGMRLHADPGSYAPDPSSVACQWLRDGDPIVGATGTTYDVVDADIGTTLGLSCQVSRAHYFPYTGVADALPVSEGPRDTTAPALALTPQRQATNGWYRDDIVYAVTATDDGPDDTGVVSVSFEMTGATTGSGSLDPVGDAVTVSAAGTTHLTVVATDGSGNQTVEEADVKIDLTDPEVTVGSPLGGEDFNVGDVRRAAFGCADDLSGVAECVGTVDNDAGLDTSTPGDHTFSVTATDGAGRTTTVERRYHVTGSFEVLAKPEIAESSARVGDLLHATRGSYRPAPSGVDCRWLRDGEPIEGATGTTYEVVEADKGAALGFRCVASAPDHRDVTAIAPRPVVIANGGADTTAPRLEVVTHQVPTNSWYTDHEVRYYVSVFDEGPDASGVALLRYELTGAVTGAGVLDPVNGDEISIEDVEGVVQVHVVAVDAAGNEATADREARIDLTDPVVDVTTPVAGADYSVGERVAAAYACTDRPSGVAGCDGDVANGADIDTATPGDHTFTVTATDESGRTTTVVRHYHVTGAFTVVAKPAIAESSAEVGDTLHATRGDYAPAPTAVECSWLRDGGPVPGATGTTYDVGAADAGRTLAYRCEISRADHAARTVISDAVTVAVPPVDTTPPVITVRPDRAAQHGWYDDAVALSVSATDNTGATSLTYEMTGAAEESGELDPTGDTTGVGVEGITHIRFVATDAAGNEAVKELDLRIDRTDPVVSVTAPDEGTELAAGEIVRVDFTCADGLSGIADCAGTQENGAALDTGTPGDHTLEVTATDIAGRTTKVVRHYHVTGAFTVVTKPGITEQAARVGDTLHATRGSYDPEPTATECQWLRDGEPIDGATGTTYDVVAADAGAAIGFRCTVTKADHRDLTVTATRPVVVANGSTDTSAPRLEVKTEQTRTNGWFTDDVRYAVSAFDDQGPDESGVALLRYEMTGATTASGQLDAARGGEISVVNEGTTHVEVVAVDAAGNETVQDVEVRLDRTNPAVEVTRPAEGAEYAIGEKVTARYGCADTGAGLADCVGDLADGADLDTTEAGDHAFTVTATDNAGRTTKVVRHYSVVTAFQVVSAPSIAAEDIAQVGDVLHGDAGTYEPQPDTASCVWLRDGAPIAGSDGTSYTVVDADRGAVLGLRCTIAKSGHRTLRLSAPQHLVVPLGTTDASPPSISAKPDRPATSGWYGDDVTYQVTAADLDGPTDSGVALLRYELTGATVDYGVLDRTDGGSVVVSNEGTTTLRVVAVDRNGNRSTALVETRIDHTDPSVSVLTPSEDAEYAVGASVRAGYACTDAGSGVATCEGSAANDALLDTSVPGRYTFAVTATDNAGRTRTVERHYRVVSPFTVLTRPAIEESAATVGDTLHATNGSYDPEPTSVDCAWLRGGTPIPGATDDTYTVVDADRGKAIGYRCTASRDGYRSLTATARVRIVVPNGSADDTSAPLLTVTPDRPAANGWYDGNVRLEVRASDATLPADTGLALLRYELSGNTAEDEVLDLDQGGTLTVVAEGTTHVKVVAIDAAGNEAVKELDVRIDRGDPSVSLHTPADDAEYALGESVRASYSCADLMSGIATCRGSVADGAALDTSSAGDHTFTVTATDNAGRTTTVERHYRVAGAFVVVTEPTITETSAHVGDVLHAARGGYDPTPTVIACQWLRAGEPITGATNPTYTTVAADLGRTITFRCTVSKAGYRDLVATTARGVDVTERVPGQLPADAVVDLRLVGTDAVGSTLRATFTKKLATDQTVVRWLRDGTRLSATGASYVVTPADRGHRISAEVEVTRTGFVPRTFPVGSLAITRGRLLSAKAPVITGSSKPGQVLRTVTPTVKILGAATTDRFTTRLEWLRDGKVVVGKGAAYTVKAADNGHRLSVRLVASGATFQTFTATSAATAVGKVVPTLSVRLTAKKGRKVVVTITATAPGAVVNGAVVVKRGATVVGRGTIRNGRVTITLKKQKPAKKKVTYVVSFAGGSGLAPATATGKVKVKK